MVKKIGIHKTYVAKPGEVERSWYIVDATGLTLGRLATQIASVLRGKNKPQYTPHEDVGDFVIVVNAEKIEVTGRKLDQKKYYWHTGYPGGIREITLRRQLELHPDRVILHAVKGMLPMDLWADASCGSSESIGVWITLTGPSCRNRWL